MFSQGIILQLLHQTRFVVQKQNASLLFGWCGDDIKKLQKVQSAERCQKVVNSARRFFTSESVTEGHPDKVCDRISDAVLDKVLEVDPHGRSAVEVLACPGLIHVAGEVSLDRDLIDVDAVVEDSLKSIGYDPGRFEVRNSLGGQSSEIFSGVKESLETRSSPGREIFDRFASQGAGDQGIMFGYACGETRTLMPAPIHIAHRLAERLAAVRKNGVVEGLLPDGKTQVTVGYDGEGRPVSIDTIVVSTQHRSDRTQEWLHAVVESEVIRPVVESLEDSGLSLSVKDMRVLVNPSGSFVVGGPDADTGLTGRKIIVDTYGGMARHGGGAFSGKDSSKVDRSAAYAARWVAKNVVASGLAEKCEIQVAYAIGVSRPVGVFVECFGTEKIPLDVISQVVTQVFDLRPAAIVENLGLLRPFFTETSCYGHFGREGFTWERTNMVQDLQRFL